MIFKNKKDYYRFYCLHPILIAIVADMYIWCSERNIDFVITSTVSTPMEDKKLNRMSDSHLTGRAVDLRSWTFNQEQRLEFIKYFNNKYNQSAAISKNGKANLVVYKTNPEHFHIQIHKKFSLNNPLDVKL